MKTTTLLAIFGLLLVVASSNAKNLLTDDDNDLELTEKRAREFLRELAQDDSAGDDSNDGNDDSPAVNTRQAKCVGCKFGMAPCCAPNFCRKKRFRPDECVEVKVGK